MFQIRNVKKTDVGRYRCQVLMDLKEILSADVVFHVRYPPVIFDNSTTTFAVGEGKPVKLECYADGLPAPVVYWKDPKQDSHW